MTSNYKEKLIGGGKVSILVPCHNEEKMPIDLFSIIQR